MLVVGNSLVSEDIRDIKFCCNLACCKGQCCVEEGGFGAPLLKEELRTIKRLLPKVLKLLPPQSVEIIEKEGFYEQSPDLQWCTKTINKRDCVFVCRDNQGNNLCAFQFLFLQGKSKWIKPISCHLYPIRVKDYPEFQTVNFEYWKICQSALDCGEKEGVPLYQYCKEPLVRRFGQDWYDELVNQIDNSENNVIK